MSYEIYLGVDRHWWWRLFGSNGRVIAHATQGHASAALCRAEIALVKASDTAPVAEVASWVDASAPAGDQAGPIG